MWSRRNFFLFTANESMIWKITLEHLAIFIKLAKCTPFDRSERQPEAVTTNSRNCDYPRARENRQRYGLLKPRVWAVLAEGRLMVGLPRSCGVREETSSTRNATKVEKEGGKYSGISLPPGPQSPASASHCFRWKPRKSMGGGAWGGAAGREGIFPIKWRERAKLGKEGTRRKKSSKPAHYLPFLFRQGNQSISSP